MPSSPRPILIALFLAAVVWAPTAGATNSFSVLTYNVAGLPPSLSSGDPATNIPLIAPKLNSSLYDVVAIQEAFVDTYYNELANNSVGYPSGNTPAQETGPFPDPALIGSGLMRLSNSSHTGYTRTQWTECNGETGTPPQSHKFDCLATKGFAWARHTVDGGVIDIYNWHADAGTNAEDFTARAANVTQLTSFVASNSVGNAVIILGDTNSFFTRAGATQDNIGTLLSTLSVKDAWLETFYSGTAPGTVKDNCTTPDSADCELRDKIFYRSGGDVTLTLTGYDIPLNFIDGDDEQLSDHFPVLATFDLMVIPEPATALQVFLGLTVLALRGRSTRTTKSA